MSTFEIKEEFILNGKPIKILSGAIHYFRFVKEYWEDCFYNLKAAGFNTVETYIPWNIHEIDEGVFDFSGNKDIASFIKLAQKMDLLVILRPTPYICAEWEFGGLPAWLLRYDNIKVRTNTELFLNKVDAYYKELFKHISDLQITRNGPVIMMQIENEYGSFGNDKGYLRALKNIMQKYGAEVPLFTSDGAWDAVLEAGTLVDDGILATVNFGSQAKESFEATEKFFERKVIKNPLMCMEFWDGWFNLWKEPIIKRDADDFIMEVKEILKRGSINLYMFIGGTNFGFYNGTSVTGYTDFPQITSYDYDAVLTEWGEPTEKFYKLQKLINELYPEIKTFEPRDHKRSNFGEAKLKAKTSLCSVIDKISKCQRSDYPITMEKAGNGYGYMLYRTHVTGFGYDMKVKAVGVSDRVHFYLNGEYKGVQYQDEIGDIIEMKFNNGDNILELLVENVGRVNYGYKLQECSQIKGIRIGVMVDIHFETGWEQYALSLENINDVDFNCEWKENTPSFYRYEFEVNEAADTFIDCSKLGKGAAFINGFNLGRYWSEGPACYLYVPAPLLKVGLNEIIIFETENIVQDSLALKENPVYKDVKKA
ncbi:beta-galactosidase family protein [Brachyspira pulli]|uniref:glycoside hydrolase family 35 protein n=1 Tax=Brachyspira pulli TaxID=310721 RepID=UPI003005A8EA